MSDKDFDLNKILNESFSRLDKVAGSLHGKNSAEGDSKEISDLSEIRLGI